MPSITLTFPDLNDSVQRGDKTYYVPTQNHTVTDGGYTQSSSTGAFTEDQSGNPTQAYGLQNNIVEIGIITAIDRVNNTITTTIDAGTVRPTTNDFIFFSKDNRANMSSLLGYYAEVKLKNNSKTDGELFAIGSEIVESSK